MASYRKSGQKTYIPLTKLIYFFSLFTDHFHYFFHLILETKPNIMKVILFCLALQSFLIASSNGEKEMTLLEVASTLPKPLGYWPLNKKFGANDASSNGNDGKFRSLSMEPVEGPLGLEDTDYSFGSDEGSYVEFSGKQFNLGNSSFTICLLVKINGAKEKKVAPILEFPMEQPSNTPYGLDLWMWPDENHLKLTTVNSGDPLLLPCSFDGWAFVGAVYDAELKTIQSFCNGTVSPRASFPDSPLTSDNGFVVGRSMPIPGKGGRGAIYASGRVASLAIYLKAMNRIEISKVFNLHQIYAEEPCQSPQCIPESCRMLDEEKYSYYCKCENSIPVDAQSPECKNIEMEITPPKSMATKTTEPMIVMETEPTPEEEQSPSSEKIIELDCEPGYKGENCKTRKNCSTR